MCGACNCRLLTMIGFLRAEWAPAVGKKGLQRKLCVYMQVLFNYGPNYITTYCSPVGTDYLAQSTTAPGFNAPSSNPPQPVRPSCICNCICNSCLCKCISPVAAAAAWEGQLLCCVCHPHLMIHWGFESANEPQAVFRLIVKAQRVPCMAACACRSRKLLLTGLCDLQPQGTPQGTVSPDCNHDLPSQSTYQRFLFVVWGAICIVCITALINPVILSCCAVSLGMTAASLGRSMPCRLPPAHANARLQDWFLSDNP